MPVSLHFSLTQQDYWQGFLLMRSRQKIRYLRYIIIALILIAFGLSLYTWSHAPSQCLEKSTVLRGAAFLTGKPFITALLLLVPVLWFQWLERLMIWLAVKRTPSSFLPREWTFSDASVHIKAPTAESTVQWGFFHQWHENEKYLVLLHGRFQYFPIPKRAFADAQALQDARRLFQQHIAATQ
ncbi:MAG: YcxB family protein [Alphaproteobacteria bacterium]|nr:YcxB family protein [Alphaproteobacteria bacterium]